MSQQQPPADWYPDPLERFDYRYWDGTRWTEHVSTDGSQELDPLEQTAADEADAAVHGTAAAAEGPGPVPAENEEVWQLAGTEPAGTDAAPAAEAGPSPAAAGQTTSTAPARVEMPTGLRGDLLTDHGHTGGDARVSLQNDQMLKVVLGEDVFARQGSMVAFTGAIDFDFEGAGRLGKLLKKAGGGAGVPLMRCSGQGELFLAHDADDVHLLWLDGAGVSVNGHNLLAFDSGLAWDIDGLEGSAMLGDGLFAATLRGSGWVAVTTRGTPVTLPVDQPTFAGSAAAVAWSADLAASIDRTSTARARPGRGSGELPQLAFNGRGFVVVQASQGRPVGPHDHG